MGQWVMNHGSSESPILDGSYGSRVTVTNPLTHHKMDELLAVFLVMTRWHTCSQSVIAIFICVCNFVLIICSLTCLYTLIRPCPWVSGSWVSGSRVTKGDPLSALGRRNLKYLVLLSESLFRRNDGTFSYFLSRKTRSPWSTVLDIHYHEQPI